MFGSHKIKSIAGSRASNVLGLWYFTLLSLAHSPRPLTGASYYYSDDVQAPALSVCVCVCVCVMLAPLSSCSLSRLLLQLVYLLHFEINSIFWLYLHPNGHALNFGFPTKQNTLPVILIINASDIYFTLVRLFAAATPRASQSSALSLY